MDAKVRMPKFVHTEMVLVNDGRANAENRARIDSLIDKELACRTVVVWGVGNSYLIWGLGESPGISFRRALH